MKFIVIIIISSIVVGFLASTTTSAQQTELTQEIQPIECVYTTIDDGMGTTTNSTCEGQPIPDMTEVIVNQGRPILRGTYSAMRAIALRVWLNGQWFTLGVDSRLTTDGDMWLLDLSDLNMPLQSGLYTVVVEVETSDGLMLRNTNAGSFVVPVRPLDPVTPGPAPTPTPGGVNQPGALRPGVVIPTILPRTQEASGLSGGRVPALPGLNDGHGHDITDDARDSVAFGVYSIVFVGFIGAGIWLIRWWRLHR